MQGLEESMQGLVEERQGLAEAGPGQVEEGSGLDVSMSGREGIAVASDDTDTDSDACGRDDCGSGSGSGSVDGRGTDSVGEVTMGSCSMSSRMDDDDTGTPFLCPETVPVLIFCPET